MDVEIDIGADVWTVDGRRFGKVAGIVLDPGGEHVTYLVIRRGRFFLEDFVVPIAYVVTTEDHTVKLGITVQEVEDLPDLELAAAIPLEVPGRDVAGHPPPSPPNIWAGTPSVTLQPLITWPVSIHPYVLEEWRNVPEESRVLREGLPVVARDGEDLGIVDELLTDPVTHDVRRLVVRRPGLVPHFKAVPVAWVERSDEDKGVTLAVDGDEVEKLPDYRHQPA